ncbi:POT family proton-dependent oligopeptide transporter [Exophiala aquamarina CBS 119918]|uniref:POT family proton-dependent oligopeptide transporter n=1 Tax=Exophiala aquamarina CBS 119918 TaxID=1182545 RepID=A0A072PMG5_9EURO|nr:POT family proton-dependent oligopeptide transporter [Exophiala aquamarina CBS 119918]KEF60533.1 POT family proton-dependent oligopeptide transporter [Exophiala aquamarina CBS 119918]
MTAIDLNVAQEDEFPTHEELESLPRVPDKIPWRVYTVAFVELCERFSYYGTAILFQNFVQRKLQTPTGKAVNPSGDYNNNPGALGQGQQIATGMSTFFSFWCYVTPLLGAYLADSYLGRFNMIMISIACAVVGHVVLIAAAAPSVLENSNGAFAAFIVAIVIFGLGTGGFKPNISPLIAEQIVSDRLRVQTTEKGERVIIDPAQTSARIYNWFYLFINIGALVGQISMAYAALYIGYYLAFLLPTIMFLFCPIVLLVFKKHYRLTPPQGSVLGPAVKVLLYATKGRWSLNPVQTVRNMRSANFWDDVRPSRIPVDKRPSWMVFDDAWVDEVRRGFKACTVFLWYPLYWVTYNQINNNLTSQANVMRHTGVPPEIVSNLDPLVLIILIPICDLFIYPALRKRGIKFTPIKKIALGFWTGAAAMVYACLVQNYIYNHNECGKFPSEGLPDGSDCPAASISIWVQTGVYILIAISEILASVTSLEYAFTKAPKNMRSMVQAFALFMTALANAIGEALLSLSTDPLLVWNYASMAVIAFVAGCLFWITHRHLDAEEDELNQLPTGRVVRQNEIRGLNVDDENITSGNSIDAASLETDKVVLGAHKS